MAAGVFNARGRSDAREGLVAAQPHGFVFGEVAALNGKAHQTFRVGFLHVERQEHDIRAADGANGDKPGNLLAHAHPPLRGDWCGLLKAYRLRWLASSVLLQSRSDGILRDLVS